MRPAAPNLRLIDAPGALDTSLPWARLAWTAAAILALAGIFTCWCDTPMIWDGAYQFCFSLIEQKPYFYLTRFHSYFLWTPMVWLSHVTTNLTVLKMAYGLPFTLAPAASIVFSWWIVRKRAPHLILWAIFGVAAAPLPGQIFIINDSIFQQHMFWPVFLGMLVVLEWPQIILVALLAVFQLSHQIGSVLLVGAAGAAALMALGDRQSRFRFLIKSGLALDLALLAVWKILHYPDSYAQREFTWEAAHNAWLYGVEGYPLRGLAFMWAAGVCMLIYVILGGPRRQRLRRAVGIGAAACIVTSAIIWSIWAAARSGSEWSDALNYRRWVVPLTMPFYFLAFIDAWLGVRKGWRLERTATTDGAFPTPLWIGGLVAAVFAVVLSIQSVVWLKLTRHLMTDLRQQSAAVVPWSAVSWAGGTPLDHWGTASFVYVLEGQKPRHILLDHNWMNAAQQLAILHAQPPRVPLSPFTPISPDPGPAGWFDFRPMLKSMPPPPFLPSVWR
jgi:hypothetical protein